MNFTPKVACETTFDRQLIADSSEWYLREVLGIETYTQHLVSFGPDDKPTYFFQVRATTTPMLFAEAVSFAQNECDEFDNTLAAIGLAD